MKHYDWKKLYHYDKRLFYWCNHSISHSLLDRIFRWLTHLGGATFTVACTLSLALLAPGKWSAAGWQSFAALSISHAIAVVIKRRYQRKRPYEDLPGAKLCSRPLRDHSFPSGHTTAIFAMVTPIIFIAGWISLLILLLAFIVGVSRVYLGLHYPSDCFVGGVLGLTTGIIVSMIHF